MAREDVSRTLNHLRERRRTHRCALVERVVENAEGEQEPTLHRSRSRRRGPKSSRPCTHSSIHATLGQCVKEDHLHESATRRRLMREILAEILSGMTVSLTGEGSVCLRRTPDLFRTATSSSPEMKMSSSSVRSRRARPRSSLARVAIDRHRDARARIRGIAVSVAVDRSFDRKTPSRRDGGARDESLGRFLNLFFISR